MGATFSLTGDNGAECFEGVDAFKYLGWVLHLMEAYMDNASPIRGGLVIKGRDLPHTGFPFPRCFSQ